MLYRKKKESKEAPTLINSVLKDRIEKKN